MALALKAEMLASIAGKEEVSRSAENDARHAYMYNVQRIKIYDAPRRSTAVIFTFYSHSLGHNS